MIEVCKGTNLSVFLQKIKQKEEMENKKPIVLNNLEEWDFTDYIDSLIQKEEAVDLEFKVAKDGLPNSLWDTYSSFALRISSRTHSAGAFAAPIIPKPPAFDTAAARLCSATHAIPP